MSKKTRRRVLEPAQKLGAHGELIPRRGWTRYWPRSAAGGFLPSGASVWRTHDGLAAISDLVDAKYPQDPGGGPTWHVSVVFNGDRRPTNAELARAVDAFGFEVFDEDNHHPGAARHLFMPVDPSKRAGCECKITERTVVEADGYTWTTPADEAEGCRGCAYEQMTAALGDRRQCPLHGPDAERPPVG